MQLTGVPFFVQASRHPFHRTMFGKSFYSNNLRHELGGTKPVVIRFILKLKFTLSYSSIIILFIAETECAEPNITACNTKHADCVLRDGQAECNCRKGFEADGDTCIGKSLNF